MLEITEIQTRLDDQFLPLEPMLTGFRLLPSEVTKEDIEHLQHQLNTVLPEQFESMLRRFDFGRFTIGPIAFCNTGDFLAWLCENNQDGSANEYPWWGSGARPSDLLLIANSDPYAVLLNCKAGLVSVFKHSESWNDHMIVVADAFEPFIRGLGTTFLERNEQGGNSSLADEVSNEVGGGRGNAFWRWFAE
ncbi:SMI1/KNR4 family protein [Bremerella cremea]|uniref:SMI1/KNR4 family protein n=1 Tax=Bremerella cremea TaxID=1031537 RepID=A0A368KNH9_9BACT|nr:SMI1/KNR4 family protein [Bremerella cremea]RCS44775.1 SMI1/KNR4 family protein [Bremerella cremea]